MDERSPTGATLTPEQLATIRRELEIALTELESLTQLCSIRELSGRAEEAVSSALFVLDAAQPKDPAKADDVDGRPQSVR